MPKTFSHQNCSYCGDFSKAEPLFWGDTELVAPVEKARIKYEIKEVEVAPKIREMEVCQS